jgi:hypothetical protein
VEELRRGHCGGGASNATSPRFSSLRKDDEEIEELKVELKVM